MTLLAAAAVAAVCLGALLANAGVVTFGLGAFLATYGIQLVTSDPELDPGAAVLAALVLVSAESAYAAAEPPVRVRTLARRVRRAAAIGATGAGAFAVALLVLVSAGAEVGSGLVVELLGIAAAVAAIGLIAHLAAAARMQR